MVQSSPGDAGDVDDHVVTERLCSMLESWVLMAAQYQAQASHTRHVLVLGVITLGIGTAAILAQAGSLGLAATFLPLMFSFALFLNHSYDGRKMAWERTCQKLASMHYRIAAEGFSSAIGQGRRLTPPHQLADKERRNYRIWPLDPTSKVFYLITVILVFYLFFFLAGQHYDIAIDISFDRKSATM